MTKKWSSTIRSKKKLINLL